MRAERRAGELLKKMPKNVGVKGTKKSSATISGPQKVPVMDETPTLEHLGISKNDSSTWQKLAAIPEPEFEARIEACKASGAPLSSRTAQRYMAIASSPHLEKRRNPTLLPSYWYTLDVLRRLDSGVFDEAVAAGKIHPEMTQMEAEALLPMRPPAPVVPMSEATRAGLAAHRRGPPHRPSRSRWQVSHALSW